MNTTVKKLIPKLRFPEFSQEWVVNKLGDLCTKIGSGSTPLGGEKVYQTKGIPFIRSQNVINDVLTLDNTFISMEIHQKMKGSMVKANDILLNITGASIGRSCIVPSEFEEGNVNQHVSIIRLKKYNPKFFQSFLSSYNGQKLILQEQTGSGREGLNFQSIRGFHIPHPLELPEQQKIAAFLTAVDTKITQLTQKKSLLEQYKKGIMQKIFNQEIRFKDDNGNVYPDWESKSLGELGSFQTSSVDKLSKEDENEVYLINYMNVYRHEEINNETVKNFQIVTANENQIKTSNLKKGDILFTPSSETPTDIGHSVVIFEDINDAVYSYHVIRFRPKVKFDILFSHYFCNTSDVLRQLSRFSTGSTRFTISVGNFSKVKVKIPNIEEQTKIAQFLSAIDAKINHISTQLEQTQTFKKGLLQQLFV